MPTNIKYPLDLTGIHFDRLTAIARSSRIDKDGKHSFWICQCACGIKKDIARSALVAGLTRSCGCLNAEKRSQNGKRNRRHGLSNSPTWVVWRGMVGRCHTPSNTSYPRYGALGITVCEEWRNSFDAFFRDMGLKPSPSHSIDRIDNNRGYGPGNCRWATKKEQARNRSNNRLLEYQGEFKTAYEWAELLRLPLHSFRSRLYNGWSVDLAIKTPYHRTILYPPTDYLPTTWVDNHGVCRAVPVIGKNFNFTKIADHAAIRAFVFFRDNFRCQCCGEQAVDIPENYSGQKELRTTRFRLTIDHITPRRLGGCHHPDNLETLCQSCNSRKAQMEDRNGIIFRGPTPEDAVGPALFASPPPVFV